MSNIEECDIGSWVDEATTGDNKEFREAVHTILSAIASDKNLKAGMVLKGGILLAIRYNSHRYTRDIDFSTEKKLGEGVNTNTVCEFLDDSLAKMVEILDYGLDCRIQSSKLQPKNPDSTHPSIKLTIGYAYKGTPKHKRLLMLKSPSIVSIDYSLNEVTPNIEALKLNFDDGILVYSLTDLIAEKYRALLQQVSRNRARRQDVYDLSLLVKKLAHIDNIERLRVLDSLRRKSDARGITPHIDAFDDPDLKSRAQEFYKTLEDEVEGELPDFDHIFRQVYRFYKSLPWD